MSTHKNIVITGATRGIGRSMALKFLQMGHCVWGCGSSQKHVDAIRESSSEQGKFARVDITDPEQVNRWAETILQSSGPPDILINNAGKINHHAPFWELPVAAFNELVDVNILGTAHVMRAFLPAMVKHRQGILINLSSGAGKQGYPHISAYCTTKFAIEGLSKSVAAELPAGMACIPLSPGVINTDMLQSHWGHEKADACDSPESWAEYAVPYILTLGPEHNGQSLRIEQ